MTSRSHYYLGDFLIKQGILQGTQAQCAAFLFGCIEPDLNPATYLTGFLSGERLRGHNYSNRMPYIEKMMSKLSDREMDDLLFYYRLGKLAHYLTDAFTYPHNPAFKGKLKEHIRYEKLQEPLFIRELAACALRPRMWHGRDLFREVSEEHGRYMAAEVGALTDIRFVLGIVPAVVRCLCPEYADGFYPLLNYRKSSV